MTIYVCGNPDVALDASPYALVPLLQKRFPDIQFCSMLTGEDIAFEDNPCPILLDTVFNIDEPRLISASELSAIRLPPRDTVHDFDLAFQLKYLMKIGKLKGFQIIGIPGGKPIDYERVISIVRKLVEQDMHGS